MMAAVDATNTTVSAAPVDSPGHMLSVGHTHVRKHDPPHSFACPPLPDPCLPGPLLPGAIKLLVEEALGVFKKEGKESLNFGISPFWNIQDDSKLPGAWWTHWGQRFLFHFGNNLYAFKNLAFSKMR